MARIKRGVTSHAKHKKVLTSKDIKEYPELIELKRVQIQLKRKIKEKENV